MLLSCFVLQSVSGIVNLASSYLWVLPREAIDLGRWMMVVSVSSLALTVLSGVAVLFYAWIPLQSGARRQAWLAFWLSLAGTITVVFAPLVLPLFDLYREIERKRFAKW